MSDIINDEVENNLVDMGVPVPTAIELPVVEEEKPLAQFMFSSSEELIYAVLLFGDRIEIDGKALYFAFAEDLDEQVLPGDYVVSRGSFRLKPPFDFDYQITMTGSAVVAFMITEVLPPHAESTSNNHGLVLSSDGNIAALKAADPNGTAWMVNADSLKVSPHTGNPKDLIGDTKADLSLVPPAASLYLAAGFADGAAKYGPYNWRENAVKTRVYVAAAMRHLAQYLDGENIDPISNVPHIGHALSCLAIIADATETGNLIDDRPKPGAASELIRRYNSKTKFNIVPQ